MADRRSRLATLVGAHDQDRAERARVPRAAAPAVSSAARRGGSSPSRPGRALARPRRSGPGNRLSNAIAVARRAGAGRTFFATPGAATDALLWILETRGRTAAIVRGRPRPSTAAPLVGVRAVARPSSVLSGARRPSTTQTCPRGLERAFTPSYRGVPLGRRLEYDIAGLPLRGLLYASALHSSVPRDLAPARLRLFPISPLRTVARAPPYPRIMSLRHRAVCTA